MSRGCREHPYQIHRGRGEENTELSTGTCGVETARTTETDPRYKSHLAPTRKKPMGLD